MPMPMPIAGGAALAADLALGLLAFGSPFRLVVAAAVPLAHSTPYVPLAAAAKLPAAPRAHVPHRDLLLRHSGDHDDILMEYRAG